MSSHNNTNAGMEEALGIHQDSGIYAMINNYSHHSFFLTFNKTMPYYAEYLLGFSILQIGITQNIVICLNTGLMLVT
jgi:hypothetical protein